MTIYCALPALDPLRYERSPLHSDDRIWPEKNCYIDIWIEVLHALGMEPLAMAPFALALDFEGDQWTFFKPSHDELHELYGVDVQELTVWKPLLEHALEHLSSGRLISTEANAFWLPDTAGTDYGRNHVKTTIVINSMDPESQTLDYFHNAAYHRLSGQDYRALFRIDATPDLTFLPLYAEFIRVERARKMEPDALARTSCGLVQKYLGRRPLHNPIQRFGSRFADDLPALQAKGLDYYHLWAFAGLRQLGAAFELAALNLRWLESANALSALESAAAFEMISSTCKSLVLKGARAVNSRRPLDIGTPCEMMARSWDRGMQSLEQAVQATAHMHR